MSGVRIRFEEPTMAPEHSPVRRELHATCRAYRDAEQAVSMVMLPIQSAYASIFKMIHEIRLTSGLSD